MTCPGVVLGNENASSAGGMSAAVLDPVEIVLECVEAGVGAELLSVHVAAHVSAAVSAYTSTAIGPATRGIPVSSPRNAFRKSRQNSGVRWRETA